MQNARLDEVQAGIKISGRSINNLRYADYTILVAESDEELKSLSMKVKEESENVGLRIWSHHFMANRWETVETVRDFILGSSKITAGGE